MNSVIIVAAGKGKRIGNKTPKQFLHLNNKQMLSYSINTFNTIRSIAEIIVVVPKKWQDEIAKEYGMCKVVEGGETRRESVSKGLDSCNGKTKHVLIHDAARPFISKKIVTECLLLLETADGVAPIINIHDSIIKISDTIEPINRNKFKLIQTPQCFKIHKIMQAFNSHYKSTDEIGLLLKYNSDAKIKFAIGSACNYKITNEDDLCLAKSFAINLVQ